MKPGRRRQRWAPGWAEPHADEARCKARQRGPALPDVPNSIIAFVQGTKDHVCALTLAEHVAAQEKGTTPVALQIA